MAGIYIHIPFCYSQCSYCDFYKTTNLKYISEYVNAVCKEIKLNSSFLLNEEIKTVYFGGGTPSTLNISELATIINKLAEYIDFSLVNELTAEVNPDDVNEDYIKGLVQVGVNRLSMGIQSFFDDHLHKMNRRHNAQQALNAIDIAKKNGLDNISIDLIYGLPFMSFNEWKENIRTAINTDVQHISAYHLTIEKGTKFYNYLKKGELTEVDEESSVAQFKYMVNELKNADFENYEISNFALPGYNSQHNSNYWTGVKYLGLGPGAHSFDGINRKWNIRDINKYCELIMSDKPYFEEEKLSVYDRYNEFIMLGLRTNKGFSVNYIQTLDNSDIKTFFENELSRQIKKGNVEIIDNYCKVKEDKRFITDSIIADFFYV